MTKLYSLQTKLFILISLISTISCDSPQRTRYPTVPDYSQVQGSSGRINSFQDSNTGTGTSTGESQGLGGSLPAQFQHCNLRPEHYVTQTIGYIGFCQSSQNQAEFALVFDQSSTSGQVCIIAANYDSHTGATYALGRAECHNVTANKTYSVTLSKQINAPINALFVIQNINVNTPSGVVNSIDALFNCQAALVNGYSQQQAAQFCGFFDTYFSQYYRNFTHLDY